jgi:hypothetical protein
MGKAATTQALSYPLRLPDEVQADALRLLDMSREAINLAVTALWDRLDEFATRTNAYAYKQVEEMMAPPLVHGHRQWRCEAEQAGRILRGQAERKRQFALILPLLEQGMIIPKRENKRGGKNRKAIREALMQVRDAQTDGGNAVELQSCNFYLQNGCFPDTYEELQPVPVLGAGILPYSGDDGPQMGQTYHLSLACTVPVASSQVEVRRDHQGQRCDGNGELCPWEMLEHRLQASVVQHHLRSRPGQHERSPIQQPRETSYQFSDQGTAQQQEDDTEQQAHRQEREIASSQRSDGKHIVQAHRHIGHQDGQQCRQETPLDQRLGCRMRCALQGSLCTRRLLQGVFLAPIHQEPQRNQEQEEAS